VPVKNHVTVTVTVVEDCAIDLQHPYECLQINSQGQAFGNATDFGAGHINPEAALNPGLGTWPENHSQLHRRFENNSQLHRYHVL